MGSRLNFSYNLLGDSEGNEMTKSVTSRLRLRYQALRDMYERARKLIINEILSQTPSKGEIDISTAYRRSRRLLDTYVTLDSQHAEDIMRIMDTIRKYASDITRKRPLNIVMMAEPGSGKSHLVKCIANSLEMYNAAAVDFNMASLNTIEDLTQPLDAVRNYKVIDRLPILFLDEFDSNPDRYPLLLPLMWEGEVNVGHRNLKVGKLVIILAGSSKKIVETMKSAKGMQASAPNAEPKLIDLLSRINGGELDIPPLDAVSENRDRRVDKVCLTVSLLHARFGEILELVPWCLLRFVATNKFRYGVRSIAHLIDLINPLEEDQTKIEARDLRLPLDVVGRLKASSLAYHVFSEDGPAAIIEDWKLIRKCEVPVRVIPKPEEEDNP